jgi:hypothetical protein
MKLTKIISGFGFIPYSQKEVKLCSKEAGEFVLNNVLKKHDIQSDELKSMMEDSQIGRGVAGLMFERFCHNLFKTKKDVVMKARRFVKQVFISSSVSF